MFRRVNHHQCRYEGFLDSLTFNHTQRGTAREGLVSIFSATSRHLVLIRRRLDPAQPQWGVHRLVEGSKGDLCLTGSLRQKKDACKTELFLHSQDACHCLPAVNYCSNSELYIFRSFWLTLNQPQQESDHVRLRKTSSF